MLAAATASPNLMLQATLFLGAALLLVPLGKHFGVATVLGYLITGLILGPSGLDVRRCRLLHFGKFGVVMLLFVIELGNPLACGH